MIRLRCDGVTHFRGRRCYCIDYVPRWYVVFWLTGVNDNRLSQTREIENGKSLKSFATDEQSSEGSGEAS